MSDLSQIHEAIETANRAFEAFKCLNDQRLQKLEQGEAGLGDRKSTRLNSSHRT